MVRFSCDYAEGCHPRILKALTQTNAEQTVGYGRDPYCDTARDLIRRAADQMSAQVHFFVGGTQANRTVISALLRPHQGVICAESGHIAVHESGAIESTGHKVLPLPSSDGKITAQAVEDAVNAHYNDSSREHTVQPGAVYISQPTETGSQYSKDELSALYRTCKAYHLPLYIDGARLAYALAADSSLTLADTARFCDVLLIGGTKCGALFGEAVLIRDPSLGSDFRYLLKQNGGMLAKGRLLGIQFLTLFSDGLYTEIAAHANALADRLRTALKQSGFEILYPGISNQIFTVFTEEELAFLSDRYAVDVQKKIDEKRYFVRICTSWATDAEAVDRLTDSIKALAHSRKETGNENGSV